MDADISDQAAWLKCVMRWVDESGLNWPRWKGIAMNFAVWMKRLRLIRC